MATEGLIWADWLNVYAVKPEGTQWTVSNKATHALLSTHRTAHEAKDAAVKYAYSARRA